MPITSAGFPIIFAILAGAADLTQPRAKCEPQISAAAPTAADPWVEIVNPCSTATELDEIVLRWSGDDYGWGATGLAGELAPGACMLVERFDQPLLPGAPKPAGLALFSVNDDAQNDPPFDEVTYGAGSDIAAPAAGEHIELIDEKWRVVRGSGASCRGGEKGRPQPVPPVIVTCAPDPDMCAQLGDACRADGVEEPTCDGLEVNVCPGAQLAVCDAALTLCADTGDGCEHTAAVCEANMAHCFAAKCREAGEVTPAQALATCFAHPSLLSGCDGELPSAGECMSLLMWEDCGITTCEWIACMEDLAATGEQCVADKPASCDAVLACREAESV
mgnify:FL=1